MNNETKIEANESIEEIVQSNELTEGSKRGMHKKVGIGLCLTTVVVGVATFIVVKNKHRILDYLAKLLEKNDYLVTKLCRVHDDDAEVLGEEWVKQCSLGEDISENIFNKKD